MREKRLAHAIVLGGSAAGLLAAGVLAHHAEHVTLVDRDDLPDAALHRKGTPQSRHANNLHPGALPMLDAWFPGVTDELERAGAVPVADEARAVIRGLRYAHTHGAPTTFLLTRPLLDAILRRRVRALGNVNFATECDVTGLYVDRAGNVAGALLRNELGETSLAGELVVDAMGRGTRARRWLSALGYAEPSVTEVRVNVHYASRLFSRAAADLQGDKLVMISPTADIPRGAVAFAVEGDRWLVTLFEYGGETPPTELSEFRTFARTLVADDIGELLAARDCVGRRRRVRLPRGVPSPLRQAACVTRRLPLSRRLALPSEPELRPGNHLGRFASGSARQSARARPTLAAAALLQAGRQGRIAAVQSLMVRGPRPAECRRAA